METLIIELKTPHRQLPIIAEVVVEGKAGDWRLGEVYYKYQNGNYIEGKKRDYLDNYYLDNYYLGKDWFNLQIQTKLENLI